MLIYAKKGLTIIISCVAIIIWQSSCSDSGYEQAESLESVRDLGLTDAQTAEVLLDKGLRLDFDAWYDSALVAVDSSLQLYERLGDQSGFVRATVARGRIFEHLSRFEDGLEAAENAIGLIRDGAGGPLLLAEAMDVKSDNLIRLGRYDEALLTVEAGLAIREELPGDNGGEVAKSLLRKGWVLADTERLHDAADIYRLALSIVPLGKDSLLVARIFNNLGVVHLRTGEYDEAKTAFSESLAIRQDIFDGNHPQEAYSLGNLAHTYRNLGDLHKTIELYSLAASIFVSKNGTKHHDTSIAYENLSHTYLRLGAHDKAMTYALLAVEIDSALFGENHRRTMSSRISLGRVYSRIGQDSLAISTLSSQLNAWESFFGRVHSGKEYLCESIGKRDLGEGLQCTNSVIKAYENDAYRSEANLSDAMILKAKLYSSHGKMDDAVQQYYAARSLVSLVYGDKSYLSALLTTEIAKSYLDGGHEKSAYFVYDSLLTRETPLVLFETKTNQVEPKLASLLLGNAYLGRAISASSIVESSTDSLQAQIHDDLNQAIAYAQKSMSISRSSLAPSFDLSNRIEEALFDKHSKRRDEYSHTNAINTLFNASEVGRVVSLRLRLQQSQAQTFAGIPDSLLKLETSLSTQIEANSLALSKTETNDNIGRTRTRQRLINATQSYDSLITIFESQYPKYYELKYKSQTASISDLQDYLSDDQAFLEYVVGSDSTYVFTVTPDTASLTTVGATSEVRDATDTYRKGLTIINDSLYFVGARKSHRLLFQPVEHIVGNRDLIIVPDDFLFTVPFEAFLDPRLNTSIDFYYHDLDYFFKNRNISYTYSATIFLETRREPEVQPSKTLLAFAPVVDGDFIAGTRSLAVDEDSLLPAIARPLSSLPASRQEVNRIRKAVSPNPVLRPFKSKIYLNEEALEANLKRPDVKNYRYVHLATHGFIEEDQPDQSSLIFRSGENTGEDGILYLGEIYNLELNADVVALSACDTGLGQVTNNEGVIGMTRGFLYAGARNLVVTMWIASDVGARDAMVPFYKHLQRGKSNAEAMRLAKLEFMQRSPVHAAPYYWAPFIVIGQ